MNEWVNSNYLKTIFFSSFQKNRSDHSIDYCRETAVAWRTLHDSAERCVSLKRYPSLWSHVVKTHWVQSCFLAVRNGGMNGQKVRRVVSRQNRTWGDSAKIHQSSTLISGRTSYNLASQLFWIDFICQMFRWNQNQVLILYRGRDDHKRRIKTNLK